MLIVTHLKYIYIYLSIEMEWLNFIFATLGDVEKALVELEIKKAEIRSYHPQSQGKIKQ